MSTYKKQKPQVTLMVVARLLPRSPKNRAIVFEVFQTVSMESRRGQSSGLSNVWDNELCRVRSPAQALRRSASSIFKAFGTGSCRPAVAASGH